MTLPKNLSFNNLLSVDYAPGQDPLIKRMAKKRKANETETSGPSEAVEVDEAVLNPAQRRLRALQMKRLAPKLRLGQERAKARFADPERLKRRAMKAARNMIFRKLTKGIPKDELTYQRRQEIEKRLDSPAMKARIERIAIKMLPKEREAEVARHRQQGQDEKK